MMLELKEKVFAQLNELGFEQVQARIERGEHLGDPRLVREWVKLQAAQRTQTQGAANTDARQRR